MAKKTTPPAQVIEGEIMPEATPKRGRKAALAHVAEPVLVDEERMKQGMVALREVTENAHALATQLHYEGPLTVGALEDEIRFYQRRTVEACLELGKRLLLLKELTPHGEFAQRVDLLGINPRLAQQFMVATFRFSKTKSTSLLAAAGSQTKLLELLVLDDDEIEALENGETMRGVTLDNIETMSVSELRKALREAKAEEEVSKKLLKEKNEKIDTLQSKIERQTPDEVLQEIHQEATAIFFEASSMVQGRMRKAFETLTLHHENHGGDSLLFMSGMVAQFRRELEMLEEEFSLPTLPTEHIPEWVAHVDGEGQE